MQRYPDYPQNLMVSSMAHVPPFRQILWKSVEYFFSLILLSNQLTN